MGLSAFTDGLMGGLQTGSNIKNAKRYADIYKQYADTNAQEAKRKQDALDSAPKIEDVFSGLADIADDGADTAAPAESAMPSVALKPITQRPSYGIPGFAQGGLVNLNGDGVFAGGVPPSSSGLTALAAPPPPPQQQAQQPAQQEQLSPQQRLTKALMTTDVLNNPDKLSKMAAFAEMHGMGKTITPWLERAYSAKKNGMIDGAMQLMQGRVDDAMDSLARGGVKLADRPEPADANNPRLWKINIAGTGERTVDIGDLLQSTLDPEKFLKQDLAKNESQGKRNVSDSQVRANDARVRVSDAQVGKLGAQAKQISQGAPSGGLGKAARVVKTVETNQGIVAVMSDGSQNVLKGSDGKPMFGTSNLKIAAGLVGKTLTPFGENNNIAGQVNDMAGQLGGNSPAPNTAPTGGVRKFNPATGKFD